MRNNLQKNNSAAAGSLAGKPPEFWQKLLEKEPPAVKPEPKERVIIERLPREQLEQIVKNLGAEAVIARETWGAIAGDLGKFNEEDVFKILKAAVHSAPGEVGKEAAKLMMKLPEEKRFVLAMEDAIHSLNADVQSMVIELMRGSSEPRRFVLINAALASENWNMRKKAVGLIPGLSVERRFALVKKAVRSGDWDVRWRAVGLIKGLPEGLQKGLWEDAEKIVRGALESDQRDVRSDATALIGELPLERRLGVIREAIGGGKLDRGERFAELMEGLPDELRGAMGDAVEILVRKAMKSEKEWIRLKGDGWINGLPLERKFVLVKEVMGSGDEGVRLRVVELIWRLKLPSKLGEELRRELLGEAQKVLREAIGSRDGSVRMEAVVLIKGLPLEMKLAVIKEALQSERVTGRMLAVELINELAEVTRPALIKVALGSGDWNVQWRAAELIKGLPEGLQGELWKEAIGAARERVEQGASLGLAAALPKELHAAVFVPLALGSQTLGGRVRGVWWCMLHPLSAYRFAAAGKEM